MWRERLGQECVQVDRRVPRGGGRVERSEGGQHELHARVGHQVGAEVGEVSVERARKADRGGERGQHVRHEVVHAVKGARARRRPVARQRLSPRPSAAAAARRGPARHASAAPAAAGRRLEGGAARRRGQPRATATAAEEAVAWPVATRGTLRPGRRRPRHGVGGGLDGDCGRVHESGVDSGGVESVRPIAARGRQAISLAERHAQLVLDHQAGAA
mmetsp:Transcript_9636/g.31482  ORF Transcript_9636/g.31482 Transcript_9636/m.31482 type:complete len:216 (+) Transcript_9636:531-1178(+)